MLGVWTERDVRTDRDHVQLDGVGRLDRIPRLVYYGAARVKQVVGGGAAGTRRSYCTGA